MIEHAIYSILSNDAGVTTLSSTRIYPVKLPQNATLPCVSYSVSEDAEDQTYDGQGTFQRVSVELDAWSDTHSEMLSLADAIKTAIKNYTGTVSGTTIDRVSIDSSVSVFEEEIEKYRKTWVCTLFKR